MSSVDPNVLFSVGFSKPVEIKSTELDKYIKSFSELTSQVRDEIAETKGIPGKSINEDRILLSTMVSQKKGGPERLVLENRGNMKGILESCQQQKSKIDEKTLARLNALLDAALNEKLQVVYKSQEVDADSGQKQELMILSHSGTSERRQLRSLEAMLGGSSPESSSTVTSAEFSQNYKGKLQTLQGLWVNPTTQDVENSLSEDKVEGVELIGLRDNPEGSADDEGMGDRLDASRDSAERGRIADDAQRRLHEEEERKDRQDYIQDRNEVFRDNKSRAKLDAESQRAHGDEPADTSTN